MPTAVKITRKDLASQETDHDPIATTTCQMSPKTSQPPPEQLYGTPRGTQSTKDHHHGKSLLDMVQQQLDKHMSIMEEKMKQQNDILKGKIDEVSTQLIKSFLFILKL